MKKAEFIDALSRALTGKVGAAEVSQHISYYSDYIDREIRLGKTEEEVIQELGDPRLLVKSIVNAENAASEKAGWGSRNAEYTYESADDEENTREYSERRKRRNRTRTVPLWLVLLIILLVILAIVVAILSAVGSLLTLIFGQYFIPVLLIMAIGYFWYYRK